MKVKQVSVSVKFTKFLGNFQTYVAEAGMVVDLEFDDNTDDVYKKCFAEVKEQVRQQAVSVKSIQEIQQEIEKQGGGAGGS